MLCFISVKEARSLWKKLRDGHREALNKKKKHRLVRQLVVIVEYGSMKIKWPFDLSNRQTSTNAFVIQNQNLDMTQQSNDNIQVEVEDEESVPTAEVPQVIYSINTPRNRRKGDKL